MSETYSREEYDRRADRAFLVGAHYGRTAARAALVAALVDPATQEAVAEALSCGPHGEMTAYSPDAHPDHNRWSWRGGGHGEAIREQYRMDADVALAAIRDRLDGAA